MYNNIINYIIVKLKSIAIYGHDIFHEDLFQW